jgi:predicted metal-dependent enzyme (double-stranded beta helix superfamily)
MPNRPPLGELFSSSGIRHFSIAEVLAVQQLGSLSFNQHPLGFVHVLLCREDRYALRLHVWPDHDRYEQQPYWPIHNHKFDLISRLITGSLTNRSYRVEQTRHETGFQLYDVRYEIGKSIMSPSGMHVEVVASGSEHVRAPHVYSISAGTFHDTYVAVGDFTATLILTKDCLPENVVKTVGDAQGLARYDYVRSEIPFTEKNAIIARLSGAP